MTPPPVLVEHPDREDVGGRIDRGDQVGHCAAMPMWVIGRHGRCRCAGEVGHVVLTTQQTGVEQRDLVTPGAVRSRHLWGALDGLGQLLGPRHGGGGTALRTHERVPGLDQQLRERWDSVADKKLDLQLSGEGEPDTKTMSYDRDGWAVVAFERLAPGTQVRQIEHVRWLQAIPLGRAQPKPVFPQQQLHLAARPDHGRMFCEVLTHRFPLHLRSTTPRPRPLPARRGARRDRGRGSAPHELASSQGGLRADS